MWKSTQVAGESPSGAPAIPHSTPGLTPGSPRPQVCTTCFQSSDAAGRFQFQITWPQPGQAGLGQVSVLTFVAVSSHFIKHKPSQHPCTWIPGRGHSSQGACFTRGVRGHPRQRKWKARGVQQPPKAPVGKVHRPGRLPGRLRGTLATIQTQLRQGRAQEEIPTAEVGAGKARLPSPLGPLREPEPSSTECQHQRWRPCSQSLRPTPWLLGSWDAAYPGRPLHPVRAGQGLSASSILCPGSLLSPLRGWVNED